MKTSLFSLASFVVLAVFTLTSDEASASDHRSSSHSSQHSGFRSFSGGGHSFSSHFYSRGYNGWSRYCWFSSYRCYGYYCPSECTWYYYAPTYSCYLPVSYISQVPPAVVNTNANANANANTNVNTNVNVNAIGGLPPGATPLAAGVVPGPVGVTGSGPAPQ